jgi:hypothetical protein
MNTIALDPLVSEFDTEEQATSYDKWFRAKVQKALDDPRPTIPHDEAMKILDQKIERLQHSHVAR